MDADPTAENGEKYLTAFVLLKSLGWRIFVISFSLYVVAGDQITRNPSVSLETLRKKNLDLEAGSLKSYLWLPGSTKIIR